MKRELLVGELANPRQAALPIIAAVGGMAVPAALFALFNAGVEIDFGNLGQALSHPVTLGVSLGLLLGKFVGIAGISWLAVRIGVVALPRGVRIAHIGGAALLGGIGFTMSIFIAELAYANQPAMILQTKLGILSASLLAGTLGYLWLYRLGNKA